MSRQNVTYQVRIHNEGEHNGLWAEVKELPGCFASGFNEDELRESLEEAIGLYLSESDRRVEVKFQGDREVESVKEQSVLVCS